MPGFRNEEGRDNEGEIDVKAFGISVLREIAFD